MSTMVANGHAAHHSPVYRHFSLPGSLTIDEELEEVSSRDSPAASLLSPQSTHMLSTESSGRGGDRRVSSTSASSTRSYSEGKTPTMGSIGTLTNERENMKTPRPRTMESPTSKKVALPALGSQAGEAGSRRKEASDATIEAKEQPMRGMSAYESPTQYGDSGSVDYATNSLGRLSVASSGYGSARKPGDASNNGSARKSRPKPVAPPELLVLVRPPPSKQSNPLNLQIQLVIPQSQPAAAQPASRASMDSSRDGTSITASQSSESNGAGGASSMSNNGPNSSATSPTGGLRRSSSMNSSRSARSEASSGGYSSLSSSSASRRVTPLYNLNFHNILATTVTDAGTDDKVAKFGKRAVEIDGFGQLEPYELLMGVNDLLSLGRRRQPLNKSATAMNNNSGSDFNSPDVLSDVSQARSADAGKVPRKSDVEAVRPDIEPPTSFDAMSPEAKNPAEGGGIGGKFLSRFKRFSMGATANVSTGKSGLMGAPSVKSGGGATDSSAPLTPANLLAKISRDKEGGMETGAEGASEAMSAGSRRESGVGMQALGHALGFDNPQLIAGAGLRGDGRRTEGYFWTVRKWNRRGAEEGHEERPRLDEAGSNPILNSVWKRFNIVNRMGGQEIHPPCKEVPVRFEWTRNAGIEQRRKSSVVSSGHARSATDGTRANRNSRLSGSRPTRPSMDLKSGEDAAEPADSSLRPPKSASHSRPTSVYSTASPRRSIDTGSQAGSHAESGGEEQGDSDPEDSETTWSCHLVLGPSTRIPIGNLAPTPHHPKLVGQLTIPFPLPDLSQSGLGADGAGLTREELKDIISVTCLFVVVREGFGGLVRKKKTSNK